MNFRYFDAFRKSDYKKGFLLILSSKIVIVAFTFLTTPIIARLYSPEDYGIYAILNSIIINLVLITNLTLPSAIIVFKKSKLNASISGIVGYSVYSNLILLLLGFILFSFDNVKTEFSEVVGFDFAFQHFVLLVLFSIVITQTEIFANLNIKEKKFKRNVGTNMTDTISNKVSSIFMGLFLYTKFGLFFADIVGKLSNLLFQLSKVRFNQSFLKFDNFKKVRTIKLTVIDNQLYPKYNLPTTFLRKFSGQFIIWIFAIYFSTDQIGYFTMSVSMVGIPLLLLSNAFNPIITKKLSEERETGYKGNTLSRLVLKITLVSIFIYILLFFISPFFVELYLGEKWLPSVMYIQILCVPFGLMLIANAISGAFIVYEKQRSNLVFKVLSFVSLLVGITLIVNTTMNFIHLVLLYAAVKSAEQLLNTFYILRKAKHV